MPRARVPKDPRWKLRNEVQMLVRRLALDEELRLVELAGRGQAWKVLKETLSRGIGLKLSGLTDRKGAENYIRAWVHRERDHNPVLRHFQMQRGDEPGELYLFFTPWAD